MPVKSPTNELKLTRVYNHPVKDVWSAWTDPDKAAYWWGPRGFSIDTHSKELKPGGHWHYTMYGPNKVEYVNKTQYLEVEEFKKLVYDHGGNDEQKPLFRVTVLFSEHDGKTTMDMTMALPTPEEAEKTRKFVKEAGGDSTWDRLAEYLEKKATDRDLFVLNRSFDVSIEKMFQMWTEPKHLAHWLAPKGFEMEFFRCDIKSGGSSFSCMSGPGGKKMFGRSDYLKVEEPNLIEYTQQFCDENEKVTRHPMAPTWPETMLTIVQLTKEGAEQTRVTITWECQGEVSVPELATFISARNGMHQGWTGSLDKLEEYLSAQ